MKLILYNTLKIEEICFTCFKNSVDGPFFASSANSHQGYFSRVQKAKGIPTIKIQISQLHTICLCIYASSFFFFFLITYTKLLASKVYLLCT